MTFAVARISLANSLGKKLTAAGRKVSNRTPSKVQRAVCMAASTMAEIKVGDTVPSAKINVVKGTEDKVEMDFAEICKGKKVVVFAVPGAYTPTCSMQHLPSFIEKAEEIKGKGVDTICCLSVNDFFVMKKWMESTPGAVESGILFLCDGGAVLTQALGLSMDLSEAGLGVRCRRLAMIVNDGKVEMLNAEKGGEFTMSSAQDVIDKL